MKMNMNTDMNCMKAGYYVTFDVITPQGNSSISQYFEENKENEIPEIVTKCIKWGNSISDQCNKNGDMVKNFKVFRVTEVILNNP